MNTAVAKTPEQMKDASPFDGAPQPNELLKFYDYSFQKGTQKRELAFIFADDKLSSYIFLSNFPEDSTDFNDGNVSLLSKGVTTETTALQYFGQNCGREVFPSIRDPGKHVLRYTYATNDATRGLKELRLLFNSKNILEDFKYSTNMAVKGS
jgi:hypothetical protein